MGKAKLLVILLEHFDVGDFSHRFEIDIVLFDLRMNVGGTRGVLWQNGYEIFGGVFVGARFFDHKRKAHGTEKQFVTMRQPSFAYPSRIHVRPIA